MCNVQAPGDPPAIDRIAPTRRPERRAVMRQNWHELLFLHWELPPGALQAALPAGLTLDLFEGRAFVGLVPFTMTGVRPVRLPAVRPLSNFHETNVRTYVHHEGRDPGVWFFSLDAASAVAVLLARTFFHLPYFHARMRLSREAEGTLAYASERLRRGPRPAMAAIVAAPRGAAAAASPGTLEHFLAERYMLYAAHRGGLYRGQVHHRPYPLQTAEVVSLEETLIAAAGLERPATRPLAHFAAGVNVEVFALERVA
jgi:uncharacterized protein YqjF (DUF2071 family)